MQQAGLRTRSEKESGFMASPACLRWNLNTEPVGNETRVYFTDPDVALDDTDTNFLTEGLTALVEESGHSRLLLDLSNVSYLNSSTLSMLLRLYKLVSARGGHISLLNPQPHIQEIFEITNLNRLFEIRHAELKACPS
jgi:anti-sigma B factor antagonist